MKRLLKRWTLLVLSLGLLSPFASAQNEELLAPEKAFAFSAERVSSSSILARWLIAPDYYMYRKQFGFEAEGVKLGEAVYPKGQIKFDEYFGEVETYIREVVIEIPIRQATGNDVITLKAAGQGCNEPVGVCYPPMEQSVQLAAAVAKTATNVDSLNTNDVSSFDSNPLSSVNELRGLLNIGEAEPEFLDVDDAFSLDVSSNGDNSVLAHFDVSQGYYLYQNKIEFKSETDSIRVGRYSLPPGSPKHDEYFGDVVVYHGPFNVNLPITHNGSNSENLTLKVSYQGCADEGICYPPVSKTFTLELPTLLSSAQAADNTDQADSQNNSATSTVDEEQPATTAFGTFFGYLLAAFGTGILLTFTPCVLPMIPIVSSIIVGQGEAISRSRGGWLSCVYVLGTAVTYAVIGGVAGATGDQLQAYFQNVWAIGFVAALLVVMSLSMFGLFEIQMPSFIQSRIQDKTQSMGGSTTMVFVLGILSALIIGACVSPLIISVISVALIQGDAVLGAAMMFSMALGMGVILIAIGFGAGFLLPKAGVWMERVKHGFGVMLLAVAIYLLGVLPAVPVLYLWAMLFIVVAVYLGATQALPEGATGWQYLWKGVGTVMLVWGVLAFVGALKGNRDFLNPLPGQLLSDSIIAQNERQKTESHFVRIATADELEQEFSKASEQGKPILIDYYADWCLDCLRMERSTLRDPEVVKQLERFALIQIDVTDPNDNDRRALKQRFGVYGPPATLFFNPDGSEIKNLRFYGYRDAAAFLEILAKT